MNRILAALIASSIMIQLPCISLAEDDDMEYAYGTVNSTDLSQNNITITEYDEEEDTEISVIYYAEPNTEFEGASSLKDIAVDDDADISYITNKEGKKIARFISVYKPATEE